MYQKRDGIKAGWTILNLPLEAVCMRSETGQKMRLGDFYQAFMEKADVNS